MNNELLNVLKEEAFSISSNHGFHDKELSVTHCIMLIITEISEVVEANRRNNHANYDLFSMSLKDGRSYGKDLFLKYIKDTQEDEFADVIIRLLDLSGYVKHDIDILSMPDTPELWMHEFSFPEMAYYACRILTSDHCTGIKIDLTINFILNWCDMLDIDILKYIGLKMTYNKSRDYKHGKSY